jgi:hypothetical protein
MLEMGVPVGAGTDATRVANYNPFNSLYWLASGKTLGGLALYDETNRMAREEALQLYSVGSSWFSGESGTKGALAPGQFADLAVLSADYFSVPEEEIKSLTSVLTLVDGRPVYASEEFSKLDPPLPEPMPDWSPIRHFGGYGAPMDDHAPTAAHIHTSACGHLPTPTASQPGLSQFWGFGCDCFAF